VRKATFEAGGLTPVVEEKSSSSLAFGKSRNQAYELSASFSLGSVELPSKVEILPTVFLAHGSPSF